MTDNTDITVIPVLPEWRFQFVLQAALQAIARTEADGYTSEGHERAVDEAVAALAAHAAMRTSNERNAAPATPAPDAHGPYVPCFIGTGTWAGIIEALPADLVGKSVWVTTTPPEPVATSAVDDPDEAYEIGKRDGYSEAVQEIDKLTGGDGEYCYSTDLDPDSHTPDAQTMIGRIVARVGSATMPANDGKTAGSAHPPAEAIRAYVEDYEFCGDGGDYCPTEAERAMLEDFAYGLLDELRRVKGTPSSSPAIPKPQDPDAAPSAVRYRNWRGEIEDRHIVPLRICYGATEWHPEPQLLLTAWDADKQAEHDFALADFMPPEGMAGRISPTTSQGWWLAARSIITAFDDLVAGSIDVDPDDFSRVLLAGCFAAEAFQDTPDDADAVIALIRTFLLAMADPDDASLDSLREAATATARAPASEEDGGLSS